MARINIEDSLFTDSRWIDLLIKVGCKHKALGLLTGAWILSQKHWLKHRGIPKKAWPKEFDILIEVELATRQDDGLVYVKGSKKAFVWLEQKSESGRKGGQATAKLHGASAKRRVASAKRAPSDSIACEKPLTLSSSSFSFSSSSSNSDSSSSSNSSNKENILCTDVEIANQETLVPEVNSTRPSKARSRSYDKNLVGVIDELNFDDSAIELLANVKKDLQKQWLKTYPDPNWLCHELRKAKGWILANPKKAPKTLTRFLNNWLNNGFENYRKTIKSNKQDPYTEIMRKIENGEL